eukprot:5605197-Karenia_brevis.AAC.1
MFEINNLPAVRGFKASNPAQHKVFCVNDPCNATIFIFTCDGDGIVEIFYVIEKITTGNCLWVKMWHNIL